MNSKYYREHHPTCDILTFFKNGKYKKKNALGSKQKQNQKNKIQDKSDQKRRDFIKKLAYHAPKFIKKASINK